MVRKLFLCLTISLLCVSFISAADQNSNTKQPAFQSAMKSIPFALNPNPSLSKIKVIPLGSRYDDSLYFGTLVGYNSIGLTSAGTWEGAIRMTPAELGAYAGWEIVAIKFYHYDTTPLNNVIKIYDNGSSTQPGGVLTSEAYTSNVPEWVYVVFTDSVLISGSGDLWASVEIYQSGGGVFPFGVDAGPAVDGKGDWVMLSGSWSELQTYGLDYNWQLCVFVNQGGGDPDIECNPNPLAFYAKDNAIMLEYTYRNYPNKIDRELQQKMESSSSVELIPVIIEFDKLIDSDFLRKCVKEMSKPERRHFTITTLKGFSTEYQANVMNYLHELESFGKVERLSQLWLTNSVGMNATKEVISEAANYPNIAVIWLDNKLSKTTDYRGLGSSSMGLPDGRAIVWNVTKIDADDVWGLGYTGQNIIDGHVDTGVNYNHVDLADHLWDGGGSYPNHGYDFINNDNDPMDQDGHGTHTAGTVAGDGTAGTQTGVAPDAQVMCLRAVPGNLSVLQNAVNFALTQNADVLSMSAGWDSTGAGGSWNYLSTQNRYMVDNCMTAGVVFSTSAGNGDGYGGHYAVPYDIGIPANSPAPWYGGEGHSSVMAVGATNQSNTLASFSSHGATQWFFSPWYEYQYPTGLIKPDVSAPGGSPGITSLNYANNNGYVGGWQGTSMACPHLTGVIALMLSKDPSLTPEELDSIIELTCLDLGSVGRDNYFGAGLINALNAVNAIGSASVTGNFYCKNVGTATLIVTNITKAASWITSVSPTAFNVAVGDSQGVGVIIDTSGLSPGNYYDTLWITSNDPDENPYPEVVILYHGTGVNETPVVKIVPVNCFVRCNPNPARNSTSINFVIPKKADVSLGLYDVSGRKVSSIAQGEFSIGNHKLSWNRKGKAGVRIPQGIYFIKMQGEGINAKGKLILLD